MFLVWWNKSLSLIKINQAVSIINEGLIRLEEKLDNKLAAADARIANIEAHQLRRIDDVQNNANRNREK